MPTLGTREFTGLPQTTPIRAAGVIFRFAASGSVAAFVCALPAAILLGAIDRLLWLPAPLSAPLFVLLPGLSMALLSILPVPAWGGALAGAWCGGLIGLSLPSPGSEDVVTSVLATPVALSTVSAVTGSIAGAMLQFAFVRWRPQLAMRLVVSILPGAIGAAGGVIAATLLPGAFADHPTPSAAALFFFAQALGLLLIAPPIVVWWQASEGCVLHHEGDGWELAGTVSALAIVTGLGTQHWFPLQVVIAAILALSLLILLGARYPLRVAAPLCSMQFIAAGILWSRSAGALLDRSLVDALGMVAMQMIILLLLFSVLMLASAHNTRRLVEFRLRGYAQRLARAEEDQRREAASTLRESIAQSLVGVRFALSHLERATLTPEARLAVGETLDVVREAEAGADQFIRELGPQGLEDQGLCVVIESYLCKLRKGVTADLEFEASGPIDGVPLAIRRVAFRIVTELVRNALEHGAPTLVRIDLRAKERTLDIRIHDDGRGFEPGTVFGSPRSRFRLNELRDRIASEGGSLAVLSEPGAGCTVRVHLPLINDESAARRA